MKKNPLAILGAPGSATGPCTEAHVWYMTQGSPQSAWESCELPNWLLWLVKRLQIPGAERVAYEVADHAVRIDAADALDRSGIPELIEHVVRLRALPTIADRESADAARSATESAARSASYAARSADYAASTARSATYAARSTIYAARSTIYAAGSAASAVSAAESAAESAAYSAASAAGSTAQIRIAGIVRRHFPWGVIKAALSAAGKAS